MLKLITVTTDLQATQPLILSAKKNGWDIEVLQTVWRGFGTKLIEVYNYLVSNPDVTEFVFADAFDVVVLGTPEEFMAKIYQPKYFTLLSSTERGLWPPTLEPYRKEYPKSKHGFNYLNSGLYYVPDSKNFIKLMESNNKPEFETDDQLYLSLEYINGRGISLDYECRVFQSYSFIEPDDYEYKNGRLYNLKTGTIPTFVHGNGRTDMTKIYELIK